MSEDNKRPQLTIIRGLPGSGKSTLAKEISKQTGAVHFEADMFFTQPDGKYIYKPELVKSAHSWCQMAVQSQLVSGRSVVVSNTFTRRWEVQPYLDMARCVQADVTVITCREQYKNIHGCTPSIIEGMRARWEEI